MTKLIFGCGYLGARRQAGTTRGEEIWASREDRVVQQRMPGAHGAAIVADPPPQHAKQLPDECRVLFSVGFDRTAHQTLMKSMPAACETCSPPCPLNRPMIYISTTGVYGDGGGDWIDEETPTDPQRDGGRASLRREHWPHILWPKLRGAPTRRNLWPRAHSAFEVSCGPANQSQSPIRLLNLIHVVDAAAVDVGGSDRKHRAGGRGPRVYCVSDGHPVVRGDYYREVAIQIGAPEPTFIDPEPLSPRAARAASDRRVRNERMLTELGVQLIYPDYRSGLRAILS